MSDIDALKKEKQELIDKMLEMQKQFIEHEHAHGVTGKDYWASTDGLLADYRQDYMDMANRVVDIAHEIVGSSRN
jgi:DNA-binding ferritin-like protein (Dps family)